MHTARRHGLRTEASIRFERGVDPGLPALAAERAAWLMSSLAGGSPAPGPRDEYPVPIERWKVELPPGEPTRLLGAPIGVEETSRLLERLGFLVSGGDPLVVSVPTYRPDVTRAADLVEEVGRLFGLNNIPSRLPHGPGGGLDDRHQRARLMRAALVGAGLSEATSWTFVAAEDLEAIGLDPQDAIRLRNPINDAESLLRTSLLPGLLKATQFNVNRGRTSVALFETGKVFLDRASPDDSHIPYQPEKIAFVLAGQFGAFALGARRRDVDFSTAHSVWDLIERSMDVDAKITPATAPGYHPTRCGLVEADGIELGVFGELHPTVVRAFDLEGRVAAGEFLLNPVLKPRAFWQFREPSGYPPIVFDLAFDVPEEVAASALLATIRHAAGDNLERIELFDLFRGSALGPGRKSLAVQLTLRSPDSTLTNEDVRTDRERIIASVAREHGGRLRGGA
jgi:phenylalanyl-tRNA synthetase beta chain